MELDKKEIKYNLIRICKGSIVAILTSLLLIFILSILLTYTNLQENIILPSILIITCISVLLGSSISTIKIKKNGFINGALVGLIYFLSIYIISSITGTGFSLNISSMIMMISSCVAGMIGGIIGVNI